MQILSVGHGNARHVLHAITPGMRQRGHLVSCYFDEELDRMNRCRELPPTDFLLLGLSSGNWAAGSPAHEVESDILDRAVQLNIACGVLCDVNGLVSAPYLIKHGSHIQLVIINSRDLNENVSELCENATILYFDEILDRPELLLEAMHNKACAPLRSYA